MGIENEVLLSGFYAEQPKFNLRANDSIIADYILSGGCRVDVLRDIGHKLAVVPEHRAAFGSFFAQSHYLNCQANVALLSRHLGNRVASLGLLLQAARKVKASLVINPVWRNEAANAQERQKLIDEISQGGKPTYMFMEKTPNGNLVRNNYDVAELWEKDLDYVRWVATELREQRRLLAGDLDEVRKAVQPKRYDGYPILPATIVPRGYIRPVTCDAAYLKALDSEDLRYMMRIYGTEAVNDRLAGRN